MNNQNNVKSMPQRGTLEYKYAGARYNIMLMIAFTVINIVLLLTGSDTYFLFTAIIPYRLVFYGMYFCGLLPADYYEGGEIFLSKSVLAVLIGVAVILIVLYLLCFFFSKKKYGWLIVSAALLALDTIYMAFMYLTYGIDASMIIDVLFHGWVLYYMISGSIVGYKMSKQPPQTLEEQAAADGADVKLNQESPELPAADTENSEIPEDKTENTGNDENKEW